jgi:very-short-patch-repair endonuclease
VKAKPKKSYKNRWMTDGGVGFLTHWAQLYPGTASEAAIEPAIAKLGRPYRAQHPIFSHHFIVDFALLEDKIIIEVDGKSHNSTAAKQKDALRTAALERLGWTVVRCKNEDAQRDPDGTVARCMLDASNQRLNMFNSTRN